MQIDDKTPNITNTVNEAYAANKNNKFPSIIFLEFGQYSYDICH